MNFDCIVVGLGSMGSAACYYLAKRGFRVLGLEQFEVSHTEGSHSGQSRIIRKAYYEHPDYVPLLERAYENWSEIEKEADAKIYHRTGLLYLGQAGSDVMSGVRRSAQEHKVTVEEWSRADLKKRYPAFVPASDFQILFEPDAGFVTPERAILSYVQAALTHGAEVHTNERVLSWEPEGKNIRVVTPKGQYTTQRLIFTSGAWTSKLIQLPVNLKVTRQTVAWMNPLISRISHWGTSPAGSQNSPARAAFMASRYCRLADSEVL
ncbi:MAG: N-methyl-L-tryptophan oxidase [Bacteroidetes bacterium]|nr:N-methyl-L-tryptophan oxidase [Bacteroidota bacterium]